MLSETLGKIFTEEIQKTIDMEIINHEHLKQESFDSCGARSHAMMYNAVKRVEKILTMAIIEHREKNHEEERTEEKQIVSFGMDEEDLQISTQSWWLN